MRAMGITLVPVGVYCVDLWALRASLDLTLPKPGRLDACIVDRARTDRQCGIGRMNVDMIDWRPADRQRGLGRLDADVADRQWSRSHLGDAGRERRLGRWAHLGG